MKIELDTPYSVGDLNPEAAYPHVYITTFFVNGPAAFSEVRYEVGTLSEPSEEMPMGQWTKAIEVPSGTVSINGAQLYPFFGSKVSQEDGVSPYLWDQVETLLYKQIQAQDSRLAGKLI